MNKVATLQYRWQIDCNGKPRHWRDRFGNLLRAIAQSIDGRASLALFMGSDPPLPTASAREIVVKGVEHMERLLKESARAQCTEILLMEAAPELFDDNEKA